MKHIVFFFLLFTIIRFGAEAQIDTQRHGNRFEQLGTTLRSPNVYRTASGAPGHEYWQQRADYEIEVELNDDNQSITGKEKVIYYNESPDPLDYLWLQLDQNQRDKDSETPKIASSKIGPKMNLGQLEDIIWHDMDLGLKIYSVTDANGKAIPATVNLTMMRLDLDQPLMPGEKFEFNIAWSFNSHDRTGFLATRPGYEYFEEDGNYIYTVAEWFPRMAVYSDFEGWQNKQFVGRGEFALVFGDYKVAITVPSDHMVGATGVLQNPGDVLSQKEMDRWNQARKSFDEPVVIRTQSEAEKLEKYVRRPSLTLVKQKEYLDFSCRKCKGLCLDLIQKVYLGCHGSSLRKWQRSNGHVLLCQGGKSTVGAIFYQSGGAYFEILLFQNI